MLSAARDTPLLLLLQERWSAQE